MRNHQSWGRFPRLKAGELSSIFWRSELPELTSFRAPVLPYAFGRSYGDCCLNDSGVLLDVGGLNRFIEFDRDAGILRCEAGLTVGEILEVTVPSGWFLPVVPGTQHVSIGGAIANDIHGKNHHGAGSFGCYVTRLQLYRSDGRRHLCSPTENRDLFAATIGGLGLTGLILWAELRLKRVPGPRVETRSIPFRGVREFFELCRRYDSDFEYSVAWLDCLQGRSGGERGILTLGNHGPVPRPAGPGRLRRVPVFVDGPEFLLSRPVLRLFNRVYFRLQAKRSPASVPYSGFFFPLDSVENWNRLYGKRGFLQYQCVVSDDEEAAIERMLTRIYASRERPFLVVLKRFGEIQSPGLLSFPRRGTTLALDFPMKGESTLALLDALDEIVARSRGAVYPAKDARMSPAKFRSFFPAWKDFSRFVDPSFSSSFWRRVADPEDRCR